MLKFGIIANEVMVALSQLREGTFRSIGIVRVAVGLFQ
jgi:uncharacterized protein YjeT (DUF2065 family)